MLVTQWVHFASIIYLAMYWPPSAFRNSPIIGFISHSLSVPSNSSSLTSYYIYLSIPIENQRCIKENQEGEITVHEESQNNKEVERLCNSKRRETINWMKDSPAITENDKFRVSLCIHNLFIEQSHERTVARRRPTIFYITSLNTSYRTPSIRDIEKESWCA